MTNYLTVNTAFSLSIFCCFCSIEGCTYRFRVVLILECPKISLNVFISKTPPNFIWRVSPITVNVIMISRTYQSFVCGPHSVSTALNASKSTLHFCYEFYCRTTWLKGIQKVIKLTKVKCLTTKEKC